MPRPLPAATHFFAAGSATRPAPAAALQVGALIVGRVCQRCNTQDFPLLQVSAVVAQQWWGQKRGGSNGKARRMWHQRFVNCVRLRVLHRKVVQGLSRG
jgi:hypothetical protein